jgi:gamma-glutamyltranspeptidase/glutathione hydrolase
MVTADKDGLVLSLTTTTNLPFGSHVMVPETGIVLNCQMDGTRTECLLRDTRLTNTDFSTPNTTNAFGYPANPNNFIKPRKRPLSSISPVIATRDDGSFVFATGAAGGSHIPTTTLQTLIHALDENLSPSLSLARPRLHHQLFPNYVEIPDTYDNATVDFLKSRKHVIERLPEWSYAQAIFRSQQGLFEAAAEPRQLESGAFAV